MRLFVAVDLSEEQKKLLTSLQKEVRTDLDNVKWVKPVNLHITMKFFGEVKKTVDELEIILKQSVSSFNCFELSLKGLGFFPNHRRPRIIWTGIEFGNTNLKEIFGRLDTSFEKVITTEKKTFTPHVTLGRIRKPEKNISYEKILNKYQDFEAPSCRVSCINLYRSDLSPQGAIYTSLRKIYF